MSQYQYGPPTPGYYYAPPPPPTNVLAVISFISALCGLAIVPVVLGHIALAQIGNRREGGTGWAIAGLVIGYLEIIALAIVGLIVWLAVRSYQ